MEGWNRSRRARGHRGGRFSRPPLPPLDYGQEHCSVPLWEREFCCYVGNISWQRFCENKKYLGLYVDLDHWDDSGALENFQNAKASFWAHYHGQPSDVPLPDPDMYIDKVDHDCKVDPGLVADLEKVGPFDSDNNSAAAIDAGKTSSQNQPGNWDMYLEKPAEISEWEPKELTSTPAATSGAKHEPSNDWGISYSGWDDPPFNDWGISYSGWDDPPANPTWCSSTNNYHSSSNRNDFHDGSSNRYDQDRSTMSGMGRSRGGHFQRGNGRQRNQAEGYQRTGWQDHREGNQRSGWQDRRGRHSEWRPVLNRNRRNDQGPDGAQQEPSK